MVVFLGWKKYENNGVYGKVMRQRSEGKAYGAHLSSDS